VEVEVLYTSKQDELASLVLGDVDRGESPVPACPGWKVRDVLAHVVGLARDSVAGNLPTMDLLEQWRDDEVVETRDRMTAEQVDRVADRSIEDLVTDWQGLNDRLTPMLSGAIPFPDPAPLGLGAVLVTDLVIHDQDVRGALGCPRAADGPASSLALATYCFAVDYRIRQLALPALGVRHGERRRILGNGEPAATVSGERFELLRAFGGRRSREQLLALDWDGDPSAYVRLLPAYGERTDSLLE
jgi:uncharacterized protein (TIGR03083 family)